MRLVFGLVLIAGISLAGFAVYMAQNYIGAYENALTEARKNTVAAVPTKMIYVSIKDIPYGHEVKEEDIRLAPWPEEILPEGAFTKDNPVLGPGIDRRVALRAIEKYEALLPTKVSEPGGSAGLGSHLRPGESAFAIKVDVASGVSGFLRPGDRVDVYWTGRVSGAQGNNEVTKLIQTGVRLIAVDQSADSDNTSTTIARTVTIAASREQVAVLTHAQSTGRLTLSLIGVEDNTVVDQSIEIDQMSMLGIEQAPVAAPVQAAPTCATRVRRGAEVVMIPIPCNN
ncbi:Flp pilus assembly protein CpaB [Sagittula salina]|uniref:Flp pilus assembly protein CpaB n=1 Tax=Sagittula salina TaxID=2820268 RepID=A0A940RYW8_9RHOB|nr:Flp pilus assembly protein CpaB [Sagittula salina]MBP0481338.1 Flp pilus assembly protein CpaB [Sagittula salina]